MSDDTKSPELGASAYWCAQAVAHHAMTLQCLAQVLLVSPRNGEGNLILPDKLARSLAHDLNALAKTLDATGPA